MTSPTHFRRPTAEDLDWVVRRHAEIYDAEHQWHRHFHTLVADVVTEFAREHDPASERGWIAEIAGERVGSVFLVRESAGVARLRLLLVEPAARGHGLGTRLVEECLAFAREAGYRRVVLWTASALDAARRIYERAGFRLEEEKPEPLFGDGSTGQTWEIDL